jgi:peptidoglycan/xylan/chitin deacetylase (PgdA/CDA1 family)
MNGGSVILMYHRVCPVTQARPWFARGTAVTPEAFQRQMQWLVRHFEVVPLRTLLAHGGGSSSGGMHPRASITFDDGYADTFTHALPVCQALGIVGTVFPVAGHLAEEGQTLWFDAFYGLLQRVVDASGDAGPDADILGTPLSRWVRGPDKEQLQHATSVQRPDLLARLAQRLGVAAASPCTALYLSVTQLTRLVHLGWSLGGHGQTHTRFTSLDDVALQQEMQAGLDLARTFDSGDPILAYPDGANDMRVAHVARATGFRWALTVTPGSVSHTTDAMTIPRFFAKGDSDAPTTALTALLQTRSTISAIPCPTPMHIVQSA